MKTYKYTKQHNQGTADKTVEEQGRIPSPEDPITKAAYEWNNALKIAAEKFWGRD